MESEGLANSVKPTIRILADVSGDQTSKVSTSGSQTANNCTIPGCEICSGNSVCTKCKPDHSITPKKNCISCKIPDCDLCLSPDVCDRCNKNKNELNPSINGDKCLVCDKNATLTGCSSCSGRNQCGQCLNGLQLILPEGAPGICLKCPISNC